MKLERLRLADYRPDLAERWDAFVQASRNGALIFERGFMDYHADRFPDASVVAFEGEDEADIVAVLPASRVAATGGEERVSHGGLTFGGWITDQRMGAAAMVRLFELLREKLRDDGVGRLRYKAAPTCFHRQPAEEDIYALFRLGADLIRCDLGSAIDLQRPLPWSKGKRSGLAKARKAGLQVEPTVDFATFHAMLIQVLARHRAAPVHSLAELELLAGRFPQRITLFSASQGGRSLAYILVFDSGEVIHTQYMAAGDEGREHGGLEAIVDHLQRVAYPDRRWLSFGISSEAGGRELNAGLVGQKEMFGARSVVFPWYELRFDPQR